jgi:hypothetical protein
MKLMLSKHFWLGFSLGLGLLLTAMLAVLGVPASTSEATGATDGPVPSSQLSAIFSRPRTAEDVLPPALAARVVESLPGAPPVPEEARNGRLYLDQSRRLLAGMGSAGVSLYAFPSERGGICAVFDRWGGGCLGAPAFTPDRPISVDLIDPDGPGGALPAVVAGLVPDNVVGVQVLVGDKTYEAVVKNHAYFLELPSANDRPQAVRALFSGGELATVALPSTLPPALP